MKTDLRVKDTPCSLPLTHLSILLTRVLVLLKETNAKKIVTIQTTKISIK